MNNQKKKIKELSKAALLEILKENTELYLNIRARKRKITTLTQENTEDSTQRRKLLKNFELRVNVKKFYDYWSNFKSSNTDEEKHGLYLAKDLPGCTRCGTKFHATMKDKQPILKNRKQYCDECVKLIKKG